MSLDWILENERRVYKNKMKAPVGVLSFVWGKSRDYLRCNCDPTTTGLIVVKYKCLPNYYDNIDITINCQDKKKKALKYLENLDVAKKWYLM